MVSRAAAIGLAITASTIVAAATAPRAGAGRAPEHAAGPTTAAPAAPPSTAPTAPTAPTTVAPTAAPGATSTAAAPLPTLPEPESEAADPVRTVVPSVVVIASVLTDDADENDAIARALLDPAPSIAVENAPGTICVVVPVAAPLMAGGRWERNGEPISSSDLTRRDPPGYGECLPNPDGEPFRDGVYQYVAVGPTGALSAAGTVVIGVATVVVWLLNDGDEAACLVHMSPLAADFYEAMSTDGPLAPGQAMAVRVADVDQDVRVFGCPPDEVLRTFRISPEAGRYVDLFGTADPGPSTPATGTPAPASGASTTTTP
jgi:hypothetical protein